ncbi:UDP-N-acetylglucosamine--N-acetylmuramyl-(pentapeptide) pyrophosphoryl-undecaprenol N-acetylglucosamine transferase [Candidatus Woesebacteria bacterium]|nr:UDP-N-acetylglucosamine--N-acetylmuramyl-(pentapeptide) pyrophosphoryl-undecaprenol N-acetylglucosamine transferase [Candidatus Woesebacteria bacterium]
MKILLTGGHLTPALGLIDYIKTYHSEDEIIFAGREYSQEKNKQPSKERTEIEKRGIHFIAFKTGKIVDSNPIAWIAASIQTVLAFFHALVILHTNRPDAIISFGSYVAVPIATAGWILGIPVITHEQTRTIGVANSWISSFAKVLAVSYKPQGTGQTKTNSVFTGNIIRDQLIQKKPATPEWITKKFEKPILYVTGGSQGSEIINTVIGQSLPNLLKNWTIIHQCGSDSAARSYKKELGQIREQLKPSQQDSYYIREWISIDELAWIYRTATAIISRAGANTTQEIALFAIPAILIPLPFSNNHEQQLNAEWLADTGGALIINQKDLTTESIIDTLERIRTKPASFSRKLAELEIPTDAASRVYALAQKYKRQ